MSLPRPVPNPPPTPLKLLSLDGGGICGFSSLIILRYLMKRVNPANPPKPCEYFDLIGGTGTSGVIALMLGSLEMDIDTCIERYIELCLKVFKKEEQEGMLGLFSRVFGSREEEEGRQVIFRLMNTDSVKEQFSPDRPVSSVQATIPLQEGGVPEAMLINPETSCKTFVCGFTSEQTSVPTLLRTYTTTKTPAYPECTIWQAARATCAATPSFEPTEIDGQWFVNGSIDVHNPVEVVLQESKCIWPRPTSKIHCLVSIGTGVPKPVFHSCEQERAVNPLNAIRAKCEETGEKFKTDIRGLDLFDRYFRFSVRGGMCDVGWHDVDQLQRIELATEYYLRDPQVKSSVDVFAHTLPPG